MKVVINNKNKYQWIFQNKTNLLFTINIFQLWSLFLLKLLYFVPEIPTFHLKFVYLSLCTSLSEKHQKSCTLYLVNFDKGTKTVYLCTWKKFQNQGHSALTYGSRARVLINTANNSTWAVLSDALNKFQEIFKKTEIS